MANTISINILANTAQLLTGMNKAEKAVKNSMRTMTKVVGVFAGIFIGGKLTSAIANTSREIDKLGKTAAKLGVGTEQLGALQYAAEQSGVSVNTLNMALQRSTRRIAEAAQGTGEATAALKELGLSAEALNQMSPDKQLEDIADAMQLVGTQSDRVRLSMKLFDSEGVALVNMLKGGSAALQAYASDAASLGILLTGDMVRGVEASNDSLNRFKKALSVVATTINVVLAPYIKYAADWLTTLSKQVVGAGGVLSSFDNIVRITAQAFIAGFQGMQLAASGFTSVYLYLKTAILNTIGDTEGAAAAWAAFNANVKDGEEIFKKLAATIDGSGAVLNDFMKEISKIKLGFKDVEVSGSGAMNTIKDSIKATEQASTTMTNAIGGGFRDMLDGAADWSDIMKSMIKDVIAQNSPDYTQADVYKKLLMALWAV